MENCIALKYKVHDLVKVGALAFKNSNSPNMAENPLPNHIRAKINAIGNEEEVKVKMSVIEVCMLMEKVFRAMVRAKLIQEKPEDERSREQAMPFLLVSWKNYKALHLRLLRIL